MKTWQIIYSVASGFCSMLAFCGIAMLGWEKGCFTVLTIGEVGAVIIFIGLIATALQDGECKPPGLRKFWNDQAEWSDSTFGQDGPIGALKHLRQEVDEVLAKPYDLEEYADLVHLVFDPARQAGFSFDQLVAACHSKLQKNKRRKWAKPVSGEPCQHISEG